MVEMYGPTFLKDCRCTALIHCTCACSFEGGSHSDNSVGQGFKTAAAGGIIVLVCNYIFMFLFGAEESAGSEQGGQAENKA